MNPVKVIREKCLDCNGSSKEVSLCPCEDCPLWPFRFGTNPYRKKKVLSQESKDAAIARLKESRGK